MVTSYAEPAAIRKNLPRQGSSHGKVLLVGHYEFEYGVKIFSPFTANQAVAFPRMSRAADVGWAAAFGGGPSPRSCLTQDWIDVDVQPNSLVSSDRLRSAFTNSTICRRNSAGYSLVETCKANGVEPYRYLVWLFTRLLLAATADDYADLMPWSMLAAPDL